MKGWTTVLVAIVMLTACEGGSDSVSPSVQVPTEYELPEDAFDALRHQPEITTLRCSLGPGLEPGETGRLICPKVGLAGSKTKWTVSVTIFEDDFYAEALYRSICVPDWFGRPEPWIVWADGQSWIAEISPEQESPPEDFARTIAEALGSTPWDDCSAVE